MSLSKKIRFKIAARTPSLVDRSAERIISAARSVGGEVGGVVALPTKQEIFTVNRSPHVDKKSREQFQLCTHRRLLDIVLASHEIGHKVIDELTKLELHAGVNVDIKG